MSEGREVLGYTLIRREPNGNKLYHMDTGAWAYSIEDALYYDSMSKLLANTCSPRQLGGTLHIGRVVRIPGEQKVEELTGAYALDTKVMWGVRTSGHYRDGLGYAWLNKHGQVCRTPQPMSRKEAQEVRDECLNARWMAPLRVTNSEPRTVVEEVECG